MDIKKTETMTKVARRAEVPDSEKMELVVWALPVRLFHWTLAGVLFSSALTSSAESWLNIHISLGFTALLLVLWRIYYGFFGPLYSRFTSFIFPAHRVRAHIKDLIKFSPPEYVSHNPAHGWLIVGFFSVIFFTLLTGVVIFAGEENEGMLRGMFSFVAGEVAKEIHEGLTVLLGAMVLIHLTGALLDSILHETNLIKGMITGIKQFSPDAQVPEEPDKEIAVSKTLGSWCLAATLLATAGLFYMTLFASPNSQDISVAGESWETWRTECSDCHELFHPSLLPGRSWKGLVETLESHFGEDASLEREREELLLSFLLTYSSENSDTEAARKIRFSLPENVSVMRITDTPYWKHKHQEIGGEVYERESIKRKTHCKACHSDAESGGYKDSLIRVPSA